MNVMLKSIQIFKEKGRPGTPLSEAVAIQGHGLEDDRHCMDERNPISMSDEKLAEWIGRQEYDGLCFHRFKTNLTLDDLEPLALKKGDLIQVGDRAVLEICSAFKKCYQEKCELYNQGIPCRLPGSMLFAVCRTGGVIAENDMVSRIRG